MITMILKRPRASIFRILAPFLIELAGSTAPARLHVLRDLLRD